MMFFDFHFTFGLRFYSKECLISLPMREFFLELDETIGLFQKLDYLPLLRVIPFDQEMFFYATNDESFFFTSLICFVNSF